MNPGRLLLPVFGLFAWPASAQSDSVRAGSAEEYFNKASRQYVKEDKSSAMRVLDNGLRAHPGDPRLLTLAQELLKEDQQQNQQQQSQQQQEEQQEQERQEKQEQQKQSGKQAEPREGDGMSKRDAERVLDELDRNEQGVQEKARARRMPARKRNPDKDW